MAEKTTVDVEELTQLAEEILDEEGQVDIALRLEEGKVYDAQVYLLGAADRCMQEGIFSPEEAPVVMRRIGLSTRDIERIRGAHVDKFA